MEKVKISVRIDKGLDDIAQYLAEQTGVTKSKFIEDAILEHIQSVSALDGFNIPDEFLDRDVYLGSSK